MSYENVDFLNDASLVDDPSFMVRRLQALHLEFTAIS